MYKERCLIDVHKSLVAAATVLTMHIVIASIIDFLQYPNECVYCLVNLDYLLQMCFFSMEEEFINYAKLLIFLFIPQSLCNVML